MGVKWEYEKREARIGVVKITLKMNEEGDGTDWICLATAGMSNGTKITGTEKLSSRAEELAINAAAWLNAGMPAPKE